MLSKEQTALFVVLGLGSALATLAIDSLRAPAWRAFELLWVWWATGLSHYFGY